MSLADRPDRDIDRVVADPQQHGDLTVVGLVVLEQCGERELKVVQHLERDVVPGGDAADHELRDRSRSRARAGS